MSSFYHREGISATGSFVSIPDAFEDADDAVKFAPKIELRVQKYKDSAHPLGFEPTMYPHTLLIDLEAVDASKFDPKKLIKDCEILKSVAEKSPDKLQRILSAFGEKVPHDEMLKADELVRELGLDEKSVVAAGGGLLWLIVIAVAVAASSCKGCAHGKGAVRQS